MKNVNIDLTKNELIENELISWSDRLASGIKLIDNQHKHLIDLINELFILSTKNEKQEKETIAMNILLFIKYLKIHFATEEKIMLTTKFLSYVEHKRDHESFILAVLENIHDYEAGKRISLFNFTKFLRDWILPHITTMDKEYFTYLRKIAVRKDDGVLSVNLKYKEE